jgi:hypothetical protein
MKSEVDTGNEGDARAHDRAGAVRGERRPDLGAPGSSTSATVLFNVVGERIINARPSGQTVADMVESRAPDWTCRCGSRCSAAVAASST